MKDAFQIIGKLVSAERPRVADPGRITRELGRRQQLFHGAVADAVYLQRKEDQLGRDVGYPFVGILEEARNRRVADMARVQKLGVTRYASQTVLLRVELGDGLAELIAAQFAHVSLIALVEGPRRLVGDLQILPQFGTVRSRIEIVEIPFGKLSEVTLRFGPRIGPWRGYGVRHLSVLVYASRKCPCAAAMGLRASSCQASTRTLATRRPCFVTTPRA